jgi:hypothetical protein
MKPGNERVSAKREGHLLDRQSFRRNETMGRPEGSTPLQHRSWPPPSRSITARARIEIGVFRARVVSRERRTGRVGSR